MEPTSKAIYIDPKKMIISRTDLKGVIEYANSDFIDISGYSLKELLNAPHNIVRHPDMPAVIFKLMWKRLKGGQDIYAVVKNKTKDGNYYWVTTKFDIIRNPVDNKITGYVAYRQAADPKLVSEISKFYDQLLFIEKSNGIEDSEKYFISFLIHKKMTYEQYINHIADPKGIFKSFFKKMASAFAH